MTGCMRETSPWPIMTVRQTVTNTHTLVQAPGFFLSFFKRHYFLGHINLCLPLSVYYASGCSIARFPEDGIVIAKNLKDQGTGSPLKSIRPCAAEGGAEVMQAAGKLFKFAGYSRSGLTCCVCSLSQVWKC